MPYPHPQFKDILVYTDKPRPGAFYQVKKDDNLSRLANRAYGSGTSEWWGLINLSKYNSQFTRRKKSTRCQSPERTYPDGYIAFCKPFPILWIPTKDGAEPRTGTAIRKITTSPVGPLIGPIVKPNATIKARPLPTTVRNAFMPGRTLAASQASNAARMSIAATKTISEETYPTIETGSSGMGSILLLAGVGLAGILFAVKAGTEK